MVKLGKKDANHELKIQGNCYLMIQTNESAISYDQAVFTSNKKSKNPYSFLVAVSSPKLPHHTEPTQHHSMKTRN
jgi:hypothetical protein